MAGVVNKAEHTVLIVEDNEVTRRMIAGLMEKEGYRVLQATDGSTARTVIERKEKVSVALLDLHMVPMGGFEFADYIHQKGLDMPIILITGDDRMDLLIEARKHRIAQILQKPLQPERLRMAVERLIAKYADEHATTGI